MGGRRFRSFACRNRCGFGFVLHRQLVAAGAQSFLITPIALNGKRKTDKLDARALCVRLSRWLDGNRDELAPIRIPSRGRAAPARRPPAAANFWPADSPPGQSRPRPGGRVLPSAIARAAGGARATGKNFATLDPWVLGVLEKLREIILALEAQVAALEAELLARVPGQARPKGLGELSLVTLDAEICDWKRFHNRKQMGSYTGCCPGEHSSGGKRRVGCIDRMGNGRVRALLVEAVWRFLKWQPGWKAAQKMKVKLADGTAMEKKTVIALARQLAVDLWRWRTGRCTMAELGWVAA